MPARRPGCRLRRLQQGRASLTVALAPMAWPLPLPVDLRSRRWCSHHHRGVRSFRRLRLLLPGRLLIVRWVRVVPAGRYRWDRIPLGL